MRFGFVLAMLAAGALALTGCGLVGGDDDSEELFEGQVSVGLTDNVPASNQYVLQNIYHPRVREIIAIVQIDDAKEGAEVIGKWYQMGVIQQRVPNLTAEGILISERGFTVETITAEGRGAGRLTLVPNNPLPEDSYELRVYIDGKLAKVAPFVVSQIIPAPAGTGGTTTQPTPVRTAVPGATATPTR